MPHSTAALILVDRADLVHPEKLIVGNLIVLCCIGIRSFIIAILLLIDLRLISNVFCFCSIALLDLRLIFCQGKRRSKNGGKSSRYAPASSPVPSSLLLLLRLLFHLLLLLLLLLLLMLLMYDPA